MTNNQPTKSHKKSTGISSVERGISLTLAIIVLLVLIFLVLNPRAMDRGTLAIVRFLAATFAGISGYLFSGNLGLEAKIPLNKIQVRATGAFAAFVVILLVFFIGVPSSSDFSINSQDATSESKNGKQQIEWITYREIQYLDELVENFRVSTGKDNLSLRFVAPSWGIDFSFSVSQDMEVMELRKTLLEHFWVPT